MRPLSLPQFNTVCQYLGHQRLITEIRHTHTLSQIHAVQTQESADTQQQSQVASHYWTNSNKTQTGENEVTQGFEVGAKGAGMVGLTLLLSGLTMATKWFL